MVKEGNDMGQVVVITGLADGMGREVAVRLARSGDLVAGFDVDAEKLKTLSEELQKIGGNHYLLPLDITNRPGILQFRDEVLKRYGQPNTVMSNVGIGFFGPFEEVSLEAALKCFEINIIGAASIFQAFLPAMRKAGKGGSLLPCLHW